MVRDIRPALVCRTIGRVSLSHDDILRGVTRRRLVRVLSGATVRSVFRRAKHAVIEAAILATRTKLLPAAQIVKEMQHLAVIVDKTAGDAERRAFAFLDDYIRRELGQANA